MIQPVISARRLRDPSSLVTRRSLLALAALAPFLRDPAQAAESVAFADIWSEGLEFSGRAHELAGSTVEMQGYMAPPLKPEIPFFVLTKEPTAICPFCDSAATWPDDIVLVLLSRPVHALAYDRAILVTGLLEIGTETDAATGFVSRVRLREARYVKI